MFCTPFGPFLPSSFSVSSALKLTSVVGGWSHVSGPPASSPPLRKGEKADLLQISEVFNFVLWAQSDPILVAEGSRWKLVDSSFRIQMGLRALQCGCWEPTTRPLHQFSSPSGNIVSIHVSLLQHTKDGPDSTMPSKPPRTLSLFIEREMESLRSACLRRSKH